MNEGVRGRRRHRHRRLARRARRAAQFADEQSLDFTLVGDPDHSIAEAYGVWVEKSMYGKKYMGIQRATFIIDGNGKLAKVFPKVTPKAHNDMVLKTLEELKSDVGQGRAPSSA